MRIERGVDEAVKPTLLFMAPREIDFRRGREMSRYQKIHASFSTDIKSEVSLTQIHTTGPAVRATE